jgi:hypothetical protein
VPAKIIKLVGLKKSWRLSPINLVTFAGTQNGELRLLAEIFYFLDFSNILLPSHHLSTIIKIRR